MLVNFLVVLMGDNFFYYGLVFMYEVMIWFWGLGQGGDQVMGLECYVQLQFCYVIIDGFLGLGNVYLGS